MLAPLSREARSDQHDKIGTSALADESVEYAKIQNVGATDRLLGRRVSCGVIEEITVLPVETFLQTQRHNVQLGRRHQFRYFGTVTAN